jgi:APA family basic amino acid/polyamine antiporter
MILMFSLAKENWYRLFIWLAIGFVIYFAYGRKHSVMARIAARKAVAIPGAVQPSSTS